MLQAVPAAPTGAPEVTGIARVGNKLTADVSAITDDNGLTSVDYAYQWIRVDGADEAEIAGATEASYYLTDSDIGKQLKVRVVFNDDAGFEEYPLTSAASEAVGPRPQTAASATQVKNTDQPGAGSENPADSTPITICRRSRPGRTRTATYWTPSGSTSPLRPRLVLHPTERQGNGTTVRLYEMGDNESSG